MASKTVPESQTATVPKRVTVALKKPHSHQGVDRKHGEKIDVTEAQATWLKELGVIE
ncbi:DUF7210 family protein [Methylocaldum sp.]|uniref:DUF7210 family protein n=1 Tax=Methylocaldum sp. TaxID=1969727 RepID=UPI002D2AFA39|nr:hypothetical protein [Methylocaldum sp.]HYE35504.1 hypothetical protein [Methylocaldum sp.]